jgi:hypothetical protein
MARSKQGKQEEVYLGEIRSLRKEIKRLKQQLRQAEKFPHVVQESKRPIKMYNLCLECGKGDLSIMDLGKRKYEVCKLCKYRKKL